MSDKVYYERKGEYICITLCKVKVYMIGSTSCKECEHNLEYNDNYVRCRVFYSVIETEE